MTTSDARARAKKRHYEKNKEKIKAYQKAWREKNKQRMKQYNIEYRKTHPPKKRPPGWNAGRRPYLREFHLKSKYGLDESGYQSMLESQGGVCAICGTNDPHGRKHNRFHVDHCHKTNAVRGLLCSRCNMGIGSFLDNVELLQKAIVYLSSRNANNVDQ